MKQNTDSSYFSLLPGAGAYDPIEDRLWANVRATIEAMFEEELADFLGRLRYGRGNERAKGYRHGHRDRQLTGTFGTETVRVPRARIENEAGKITEWRSKALPRYRRLTKKAEALIAAVYLAGTNTRCVKRALFGLFEGAVSKDVVSRAWRKVKVDWDAWSTRDLAEEDIVRLILDGTVIKTRLDPRPPTSRCWRRSACGAMGRRCSSRSGTWAAKARLPGAASSPTWTRGACRGPSS